MYWQVDSRTEMIAFAAFHMEHSGQYSVNTKASVKFAVARIDERFFWKTYTDSDIVKMEEQATFN